MDDMLTNALTQINTLKNKIFGLNHEITWKTAEIHRLLEENATLQRALAAAEAREEVEAQMRISFQTRAERAEEENETLKASLRDQHALRVMAETHASVYQQAARELQEAQARVQAMAATYFEETT